MKRRVLMLALGGGLATPHAFGQSPRAPRRLAVLNLMRTLAEDELWKMKWYADGVLGKQP